MSDSLHQHPAISSRRHHGPPTPQVGLGNEFVKLLRLTDLVNTALEKDPAELGNTTVAAVAQLLFTPPHVACVVGSRARLFSTLLLVAVHSTRPAGKSFVSPPPIELLEQRRHIDNRHRIFACRHLTGLVNQVRGKGYIRVRVHIRQPAPVACRTAGRWQSPRLIRPPAVFSSRIRLTPSTGYFASANFARNSSGLPKETECFYRRIFAILDIVAI